MGSPGGTALIGVPFYLADERLERIEAEMSASVDDHAEAMREDASLGLTANARYARYEARMSSAKKRSRRERRLL